MTFPRPGHVHPRDPVAQAWSALRDYLAGKSRALNDEVSGYPTPIARCDEQLPKLLEQRARAVRQLRLADETGEPAADDAGADRLRRLADFLRTAQSDEDDDVEHALRRRLAEAVSDAIGAAAAPIRD
ncbi:MAG TPA: hypothetical protein VF059_09315 [Casimicrobiaceae bacterium]